MRRIDCRDILYIEVEGRGVRVHTRTESLPIPEKISEISARLPIGHLVKCHQSFIVNIEYVRLLRRYEAFVQAERPIPVSKAYYAEVKERLMRYVAEG